MAQEKRFLQKSIKEYEDIIKFKHASKSAKIAQDLAKNLDQKENEQVCKQEENAEA